jgi:hypothetical protein
MPLFRARPIRAVFVFFGLGVGCAALGCAWFMRPLVAADHAFARNDDVAALAFYAEAETRFTRLGVLRRLLPGLHDDAVFNQLALLYRAGEYERLLQKTAAAPAGAGSHFWAGTTLLRKALLEKEPDAQLAWLERSEQELALALGTNPDDWDTKFNYEMAARLVARLRQEPEKRPGPLLQLLRPQAGEPRPKRRVG